MQKSRKSVVPFCVSCFCLALAGFVCAAEDGTGKEKILKPGGRMIALPPEEEKEAETSSLLRLEIADADGPCAGRVELRNLKGETLGALAGLHWAWAEGTFSLRVPGEPLNVRVTGGPRKRAWERQLAAGKGQPLEDVAALQSYGQVYQAGWVACDPFLQADAGAGRKNRYCFGTLKEISVAARAEGVRVLGIANAGTLLGPLSVPFRQMPEGEVALASAYENATANGFIPLAAERVELANRAALYVLGVSPAAGAETNEEESLFAAGTKLLDRGGLVVLNHPTGLYEKDSGKLTHAAEDTVFAVVAGLPFAAVDVGRGGGDLEFWFTLLKQGFRVTAVAGGPGLREKESLDIPAMGCYLRLAHAKPGARDALESLKQGQAVVSNGPFVRLRVDETDSGGVLPPGTAARDIFVEGISCSSESDDIAKIELIYNGELLGQWKGDRRQKSLRITLQKSLPDVGWILARYYSTDSSLWAITNPIYIRAVAVPRTKPLAASFSLFLEDGQTGRPVGGVVEIRERNTPIATVAVDEKGKELAIPPAAVLRINAEGYNPLNWSFYRDGEACRLIEEWKLAGKLREALTDHDAYSRMREILTGRRISIQLQPVFLPE